MRSFETALGPLENFDNDPVFQARRRCAGVPWRGQDRVGRARAPESKRGARLLCRASVCKQ